MKTNSIVKALMSGHGYSYEDALEEFDRLQDVWDSDPYSVEDELLDLGLEPDYIDEFM